MRELWVRGIFFRQVLDYIKNDRGHTSFEVLEKKSEDYTAEEKYSFDEFMELLARIKLITANEDDYVARISRDTMMMEATWKNLFRRMDPVNVFASTKRQDGRHQTGDYEPILLEKGHVMLRMKLWTENRDHQELWTDFYRGRLEGILGLIGRNGTVKVTKEFGNGGYTYDIEWT
jgi:hypothetical protein